MTKAQIKRWVLKCFAAFKRIGLHNRNFSLISNNCWGGHIYDLYGLQYKTHTIGLLIPPKDYIKFLSNLEFYLKQNLIQISYNQSHISELLVKRKNEGRYDFDLKGLIVGRLLMWILFSHAILRLKMPFQSGTKEYIESTLIIWL